jgi:hypothetical protein
MTEKSQPIGELMAPFLELLQKKSVKIQIIVELLGEGRGGERG